MTKMFKSFDEAVGLVPAFEATKLLLSPPSHYSCRPSRPQSSHFVPALHRFHNEDSNRNRLPGLRHSRYPLEALCDLNARRSYPRVACVRQAGVSNTKCQCYSVPLDSIINDHASAWNRVSNDNAAKIAMHSFPRGTQVFHQSMDNYRPVLINVVKVYCVPFLFLFLQAPIYSCVEHLFYFSNSLSFSLFFHRPTTVNRYQQQPQRK